MYKKLAVIFLFPVTVYCQYFNNIIDCVQEIAWNYDSEDYVVLKKWIEEQNENGSWDEFQYGTLTEVESDKNFHLHRLLMIAKQVSNPNSTSFNDSKYLQSIRIGLIYWLNSKTVDVNWWDNFIKFPKTIGEILILMREAPGWKELNVEQLETGLIKTFHPSEIKDLSSYGRGSNMLDFALHYLYRGILTTDSELIINTTDYISNNLETHIQEDLSFHQHEKQLHIASYGLEFSKALVNIAYCLKNTDAELNFKLPHLKIAVDFIYKTQLNSFRGGHWDYNVVGRGISRIDGTKVGNDVLSMINKLKILQDDYSANEINHYPELHKHFWESDYTQHIRKNYTFNVRTLSKRTIETETRRGENLKGNYLCYGSCFMSINGKEYENIMPVWDWSMIPGITLNKTNYFPLRSNDKTANYGRTSFVGGLSDGKFGLTAFQMDVDSIKIKKGWFFFDEEIVCLGTDIKSNSYLNLRTTVNQCLAGKSFEVINPKGKVIKKTKGKIKGNLKWVIHDNFGYYFPTPQNIEISIKKEKANWQKINNKEEDTIIQKRVFKLWLNHVEGEINQNNYSYIVIPNILSEDKVNSYNERFPIEILANTKSVQAVQHKLLNLAQIIFYEKTEFIYNSTIINVSEPCLVMINNTTEEISVCDPTQNLESIKIVINSVGKKNDKNFYFSFENQPRGSTITQSFKTN